MIDEMRKMKIHWSLASSELYVHEALFDAGFDMNRDYDFEVDDRGNHIYTQSY